jgi:hypothetical protein
MVVFSAFRDFAEGLTRGFSLFFTERNEFTARTLSPPRQPGRKPLR